MATVSPLEAVLTDSIIRSLAGERYYERGVDYFRRNRVVELEQAGDVLQATVSGTEDYGVRLSASGSRFEYVCACPVGDEGQFCKHCVATALAWLADQSGGAPKAVCAKPIGDKDIEAALSAQEKGELIATLLEWSQRDKVLRQRLVLLARARSSPGDLVARVRAQVEKAIRIRGFIAYDQASGYESRVESALDAVQTLIAQGHAEPAIDLCESAMKWLEGAVEHIDDSDCQITALMELVAELHLKACDKARPEPVGLGLRLLSLEMSGSYSQWSGAAEKYAHLLGEPGLAAFRAAAEKAWAKVPTRTVRESHVNAESHYSITRIMESLARQSGDVGQLVAVLERDLSHARQYLSIADAYRQADKHDKALDWAERGMALYPGHEGKPLRLFVAEEYRRAERHADALRILWSEFRSALTLESYKLLESFARAADDWDDWRDRAFAYVRRSLAERNTGSTTSQVWWRERQQGHSLLVEMFLHENNNQDAWAAANTGGCSEELWLRLAAERSKSHPDDAVAVYFRIGERTIVDTSNGRYESAVALFEQAASLMQQIGRNEDFVLRFDALRQRFKVKRNLQKLAESRRKFLYLR